MSSNLQSITTPQGDVTFGGFVKNVALSQPETGKAYMGKVSFSEGLPEGYSEGTMTVTVLSDGLVKYIFNSVVSPYSQYECYSVNGGEPTEWSEGGGGNSFTFIECVYNTVSDEITFVDDLEVAFNKAYESKPFSLIRLEYGNVGFLYSGMPAVLHSYKYEEVEDDRIVWEISFDSVTYLVYLGRTRTYDSGNWGEWEYVYDYHIYGNNMNEYNFIKAMVMPSVNSYGNMLYIDSPIEKEFYYRLESSDGSFDYCDGDVYEYGCEGIYSEPIPLVGDTNVYLSVVDSDGSTVAFNVNTDPRYEYALNMRFNTTEVDDMGTVFGRWVEQFNRDLVSDNGWRSAESGNYNYVMYAQQHTGGTWPNSFKIDEVWVTGDDYVVNEDGQYWDRASQTNDEYNLNNPSGTRQVCYPIMLNSESNIGKMFKAYDWLYENWDKIPANIEWLDGEEPKYDSNIIIFNKEKYIGTPYLFGMLCYIMLGITDKAVEMWNNTISQVYSLNQKYIFTTEDMNNIYVSFTNMVECLKEGRYKVIE